MTANLSSLGYTERESAFIAITGLQSGYFLRRQFNTFIGRECGALGQHFIDRSLRLGHVKMMTGWGNRVLYHFCARAVYAQLGEADNRNRREHRPDTIRRRLMILDYVIARPAEAWLLTDKARSNAFARFGALEPVAPAVAGRKRAQCLDDRQPVSIDASGTPTFAFVDAGLRGFSEWERFLKSHRHLLGQIDQAETVFASCDPTRFQLAESLFRRVVTGEASGGGIEIDRLRGYFSARRLFEERRYEGFDQARLDRLREDQRVYAGEAFEQAYARWQEQGEGALLALKRTRIRFQTQVLIHPYAWLSPIRFQERRACHGPHSSTDEESSRGNNGQARHKRC
jgi:hypothetical protein